MEDYLSRDQIKVPNELVSRKIGAELREAGFKYILHRTWGYSVTIPSTGEQLTERAMSARYHDSDNPEYKKEIKKALEYFVICEKVLSEIEGLKFSLS